MEKVMKPMLTREADVPGRSPERVVCAAYVMNDGLVVSGARHYSPDMRRTMQQLYGPKYHLKVNRDYHDGGFINQFGDYLTREEAWVVADREGQLLHGVGNNDFVGPRKAGVGDTGTLYSENLY